MLALLAMSRCAWASSMTIQNLPDVAFSDV
jgi:hypothetical protein